MHTVRDRNRYFDFDGVLIAESSSKTQNSTRWVEFSLYRTLGREYVISRIGKSRIFHGSHCPMITDTQIPFGTPESDASPCVTCRPDLDLAVRPETPRYFARVHPTADDVVEKLYRTDAGGVRYLTRVARSLIEAAAQNDPLFTIPEQTHNAA